MNKNRYVIHLVKPKESDVIGDDQLLVDFSKKDIKEDSIKFIRDNKEEYEPIIISKKDEAERLQTIGQVVHIGYGLI